jgi:hypothetical protein
MRQHVLVRFLSHVQRDPVTGCWLWQSSIAANTGYGLFKVSGRNVLAHRWAYQTFRGPIPAGLELDHVRARGCDNRHCVRPSHLEPVTCAENNQRRSPGRISHAERERRYKDRLRCDNIVTTPLTLTKDP